MLAAGCESKPGPGDGVADETGETELGESGDGDEEGPGDGDPDDGDPGDGETGDGETDDGGEEDPVDPAPGEFLEYPVNDYVIRIHPNRRVAEIRISQAELDAWLAGEHYPGAVSLAPAIYEVFEDEFDFIVWLNPSWELVGTAWYSGEHITVRNSVEGIGMPIIDEGALFGSESRLKGSIHLTRIATIPGGPSLHELVHQWANGVLPTAYENHWGFAGVGGQLGGFGPGELVDLGNGDYEATLDGDTFGIYANGGNYPAYAALELYLMGMLAADEVPDIEYAADGTWIIEHQQFHSEMLEVMTMEEIIAEHGPRSPAVGEAQTEFRVLFIALTVGNELGAWYYQNTLWSHFDVAVREFTRPGPPQVYEEHQNFWTATGGRGTLVAGPLHHWLREDAGDGHEREIAAPPVELPALPIHH